ncbi:MAG TPA: GerMN domain-containing protein [Acidimicrobiia bacterium]|nr:GerMN domain-containing protein [Acidimicrobiia bacterium]
MGRISHLLPGLVAVTLVLSACGSDTGEPTTTSEDVTSTTSSPMTNTTTTAFTTSTEAATTTSVAPGETGLVVYFLLEELEEETGGPFLVPVYRDMAPGSDPVTAALGALVEGPTTGEADGIPSISSALPEGTTVLGVDVDAGVANVDLSDEFDDGGGSFSMIARLGQVVFTATRFDDVDRVQFLIEGAPVTVFSSEGIELSGPQDRSEFYDLLPPIFVDSPAWGEPVTSPVAVKGLSNVFEAVSQVMLTDDDGLKLFEDNVMATCGTGCWGDWEVEIPYTIDREQFGSLIVWENSARDGSQINVREYPIQLR